MQQLKSHTLHTSTLASLFATASASAAVNVVNTGFTVFDSGTWESEDIRDKVFEYEDGEVMYEWDIDGDLEVDVIFRAYNSATIDLEFASGVGFHSNGSDQLLNLAAYAGVVGAALDFATGSLLTVGAATFDARGGVAGFSLETPGYIGFKFDITDTIVSYGWAEVIFREDGLRGEVEIVRWAYTDDGSEITVGAIPETSSAALGLGLLAAGAAGIRRMRHRKAS